MPAHELDAATVARFLQDNPSFFTDNASIFSELNVPHPHQTKAISLGERQILTLRSRVNELEWQLSGLIQNATGNERISQLLISWCSSLLAENNVNLLPNLITNGISKLFELPDISLRVWGELQQPTSTNESASIYNKVSPELQKFVDQASGPVCGSVAVCTEAAKLMPEHTTCLAVLPLKTGTPAQSIGVLILGSPDTNRFTPEMGTDFLQTIANLASAALSRLAIEPAPQLA